MLVTSDLWVVAKILMQFLFSTPPIHNKALSVALSLSLSLSIYIYIYMGFLTILL
jgi:hypothetical protein